MKLNDESIMPFGKYKGVKMANVPADYLFYLYDKNVLSFGPVLDYIVDNLDAIKSEIELKSKFR